MKKLIFLTLNLLCGAILSFTWAQGVYEQIGPEGGNIQCMITDYQGNILVGTQFGGIYKTTNFGDSWSQIFNGNRNVDVRSLTVNSNNNYFAGTDNGGFFRSTTAGATWEKVFNILDGRFVNVLQVVPNNDIYAGTSTGVYKSTDNGTTFFSASNGITTSLISSLGYSGSYLLCGTYYAGIFRSDDNAATWQSLNSGLDYTNRTVTSINFFGTSSTPYISLGDKFYYYNISNNTWEPYSDPPKYIEKFSITDIGGVSTIVGAASSNITTQGGGVITHSINNPNDPWLVINSVQQKSASSIVAIQQSVMVGYHGEGVAGSIDGLSTFQYKNNNLKATNITAMTKSQGDSVITIGTATGQVWVSQNGGYSWENDTYDLPPGSITDIAVDENTFTTIVTTPNGVYTKKSNETSWQATQLFGQSVGVNSQGTSLVGYGNHIYVSNDDFQTHTSIYTGAPGATNIVFDNYDKAYFGATDQYNFQSDGVYAADPPLYDNWVSLGPGLENKIVTHVDYVNNGTFTSNCTGSIYAGTKDGGLFIFNNNQFTEHSNGIVSSNPVTSIVSAILSGNTSATIQFAQEIVSTYNPELCSSTQVQIPEDIRVRNIRVFESLRKSNTMSKHNAESLFIYYGTAGTGVLRRDLLSDVQIISADVPLDYSLEQNYPNPFNPNTTIEFSIPERSFVKLEILNTLGQKVTTLVSDELSAGNYKYEWSSSNLSSGVYFYELITENFSQLKKMILLK